MPEHNVLKENLAASARVLRERLGTRQPEIGLILGSGLGPLAERIEDAVYVPFGEVPHMKTSTAMLAVSYAARLPVKRCSRCRAACTATRATPRKRWRILCGSCMNWA